MLTFTIATFKFFPHKDHGCFINISVTKTLMIFTNWGRAVIWCFILLGIIIVFQFWVSSKTQTYPVFGAERSWHMLIPRIRWSSLYTHVDIPASKVSIGSSDQMRPIEEPGYCLSLAWGWSEDQVIDLNKCTNICFDWF